MHWLYQPIPAAGQSAGGAVTLTADAGSFTFTGSDVSLEWGRELVADSGSFTFTGSNVTLSKGVTLAANSGSFTFTGSDVTFLRGYEVAANAGSFLFTGTDVSLEWGHEVPADSGTFTFTGSNVSLEWGRELVPDAGSFLFTGSDATLTISQGPVLIADGGSFLFSGTDVDLLWTRVITGPYSPEPSMTYERAVAVTPNDSTVVGANGLYIGGAGNVTIKAQSGDTAVLFTAVPVGTVLNVNAYIVQSTGTTATAIVALY